MANVADVGRWPQRSRKWVPGLPREPIEPGQAFTAYERQSQRVSTRGASVLRIKCNRANRTRPASLRQPRKSLVLVGRRFRDAPPYAWRWREKKAA